MDVIHRVTFRTDGPATSFFKSFGYKINDGIINGFDIGESDLKWPHIQDRIKQYGTEVIGDFQYKTEFTRKEITDAEFLILSPQWHFEYPQPSDDFGYKGTTYKREIGCQRCSVGLEQQNPFSIRKAPKWGRRNILQLNWVFGDYFVSKEIRCALEGKIPGLGFLEVLKYPKGTPLDDIFQMIVGRRIALAIPENERYEICESCDSKKYLPHTRGFFPLPEKTNFSIAKTQEFFGSGGSARQEMIINKITYCLLIEAGIKGVNFIPCA